MFLELLWYYTYERTLHQNLALFLLKEGVGTHLADKITFPKHIFLEWNISTGLGHIPKKTFFYCFPYLEGKK